MANIEEQANQQNKDITKTKSPKSAAYKKSSTLIWVLCSITFVITLTALIISLCTYHSSNEFQNNVLDKNKSLYAEIQQLQHNQENNQKELITTVSKGQQLQDELQRKMDNLNKELQSAVNQKFYQNQDWLLLKARYYLELAQINVHWSDNFDASIALLEQADKLLQHINSPKIFAVRQLIAKEMIQLKALPTVDKVGILSQLDAAQSSVDSLRIQTKSNIESDEKPSPANASGSNWRNQVDRSINLLEKLIVVRRNDENIEPLVSPLLESALRENIRLNFQEAQWAVINNNSVVYLFALTQAEKNLKRTFNTQNTTVLLKQVNELQQIKLGVEKPKEQLALPALNQVIDNKELLGDEGSDTKKGVKGQ